MKTRALASLAILLALSVPAVAQDDPFEAIVSNPDGAEARLDDVSIPVRNPTEDELRQYLEAFRAINLNASFTVDDGQRSRSTNFTMPAGKANLGPFSMQNGTKIHLKTGFTKRPGEKEAKLRTLEFVPSNPTSMGPLRFNKMTMDAKGVLHLKLNLNLMGFDFWPQELTIEKIYRDAEGNLVFKTGGTGLAGKFVPDMRITPDGRVQRWSRGIWFFGWRGSKWKTLKDKGKEVRVTNTIPISSWPPKATDILDWLPGNEKYPRPTPVAGEQHIVEAVPVKDLSVAFVADADPRRIELSDGGALHLSEHRMRFDANGDFKGSTYTSDPNKPNGFLATARLRGDLKQPALGQAKLEDLKVEIRGTHSSTIPFSDPDKIRLDVDAHAKVRGKATSIDAGLPGGPRVRTPEASLSFDGGAGVTLRPGAGTLAEKRELRISKDSKYTLSVPGEVQISGLKGQPGQTLPESVTLSPRRGESGELGPVLQVEGELGSRMGFLFAKTQITLEGQTKNRGVVGVLNGDKSEVKTTLRPGAHVSVRAYAFAGIKKDNLVGGGVRVTADAKVAGEAEGTTFKAEGMKAELPGRTRFEGRFATNTRYGTTNGAEVQVRSVAASAKATLVEGEGKVESGLPGGPQLTARVAPGTSLSMETGKMIRPDVRSSDLATEKHAEGQQRARFNAHLVIVGGSVAHKDLSLAFKGRTTVDLSAAVGFRVDTKKLLAGQPQSALKGSMPIDLDLSISFAKGSSFALKQGSTTNTLTLRGQTHVTAHVRVEVDAQTGKPILKGLNGIDLTIEAESLDLKSLTQPLGAAVTARVGSRAAVRIKQARVEFLEKGLRIHHKGVVMELAPGTIEIGTN